MNGAIHFNDEPDAWRTEVSDELPADGHLAAEEHAELTRLQRGPKKRLRLGEAGAMLPSEELEPSSGLEIELFTTTHMSLQRRQRAGRSIHGAGCVTRLRRVTLRAAGRRGACASRDGG